MSITLTYTFGTAEELAAHINGHGRSMSPVVVKTAVGSEAPHATATEVQNAAAGANLATGPAGAKKPGAAEPSAQAASAASSASSTAQNGQSTDASEAGKTYTVDDAKALTMKIVSAKGRDAAVELLKKYGVPVAAKLPADQITAFCADAEKVLA